MRKQIKKDPEAKVTIIETFCKVGSWELSNMLQKEPSCFNGIVRIKRYRVTVEEIEEPVEVLQARLQKLWEESDNMHHYNPLVLAAKELGIELTGPFGGKFRKS